MRFHIITSDNSHHYQDILQVTFEKYNASILSLNAKPDGFDTAKKNITVVCVDDKFGVCGFARLQPTFGSRLNESALYDDDSNDPIVWALQGIHLFLPQESTDAGTDVRHRTFAMRFYHELFAVLHETCIHFDINELLIFGRPSLMVDLCQAGWPLEDTIDDGSNMEDVMTFNSIRITEDTYDTLSLRQKLVENVH